MKTKTCTVCGKEFSFDPQPYKGKFGMARTPWNTKICSDKCRDIARLRRAKEQSERKRKVVVVKKCKNCGKDVVSSQYCPRTFCEGKAGECYKSYLSQNRQGKKNPAYRNGLAMAGKRIYTGKHLRACSKYRKAFLEKHRYLFCEVCWVNQHATPKFEVHHIYFASLYPKHKELHNPRNLILVCLQCHNDFHSGKMRSDTFNRIEKERGLKELFKS